MKKREEWWDTKEEKNGGREKELSRKIANIKPA